MKTYVKTRIIMIISIIILFILTPTSFAETNTISSTPSAAITAVPSETADNQNVDLNLYSQACVLLEKSTGKIAYEKNADKKMYPASTTKLLTAILTIENCDLTDTVTITKEMVTPVPSGYTTAYLKPGDKLTVEQLLNVLLIPSANDAGFALAIHISGSVEEFADLMNKKATEIGCTNSHFTNPSGIHDDEHYSTAKDMALIGMYATSYPQITDIVCKTSYTLKPINSGAYTFETTNTLIKPNSSSYYEYATGMKTGFTDPAGSCIVSTAKKDDMEFLAVVLNAPEPDNNIVYRDEDCKTLFEYGFTNFEEIVKVDEEIVNFIDDTIVTGTTLSSIVKVGISLLGIFLLAVVVKSRSSKGSKKVMRNN